MAPRVDPVASDEALPASTGVVIIGGGIIGTCTAFYLARKGVPVVLCEKGHIAGEQSSRNWGWCRKMGRDPREIPLAIEALRLWGEMNDAVQARDRLPPLRHRLSVQDAGGPGQARPRGWRRRSPISSDTRHADARRSGGEVAWADRRMAGGAVYGKRWTRRAADGRAGDRRGGAPARRHHPDAVRGARHRNESRARFRAW